MELRDKKPEAGTVEYRREVIGLFQSPEALENAISELGSAGWDRAEMSLLGENLGSGERPADVAEHADVDREPVVTEADQRQGRTLAASMAGVIAAFVASGATIMTGGTAVAAIVGAAAAGGGATVAVEAIGRFLGGGHDQQLRDQMTQGGILLWVLLREGQDESRAREIMKKCGAVTVRAHDIPQSVY